MEVLLRAFRRQNREAEVAVPAHLISEGRGSSPGVAASKPEDFREHAVSNNLKLATFLKLLFISF